MRRRILLAATTLAALAVAMLAYYYGAGTEGLPDWRIFRGPASRPTTQLTTQQGPYADFGEDVRIIARDQTGRLEGVYRAARWNRRPDGSHVLVHPRVELFHKDGQRTLIQADMGEVYGEELARGVNIRRARLSGNVRVYFDRFIGPDRPPLEEVLNELIRIHMDDVELDRDLLTIRTDGPVTVFSPEADIYGRGLTIAWNESPQELRSLRIEHGEYMAVYEIPADLDIISLPGERAGEGGGPASGPGATGPASTGATGPASTAATGPASTAATGPASTGATGPASAAATASTQVTWPAEWPVPASRPATALAPASAPASAPAMPASVPATESRPASAPAVQPTQPATAPATVPATEPASTPAAPPAGPPGGATSGPGWLKSQPATAPPAEGREYRPVIPDDLLPIPIRWRRPAAAPRTSAPGPPSAPGARQGAPASSPSSAAASEPSGASEPSATRPAGATAPAGEVAPTSPASAPTEPTAPVRPRFAVLGGPPDSPATATAPSAGTRGEPGRAAEPSSSAGAEAPTTGASQPATTATSQSATTASSQAATTSAPAERLNVYRAEFHDNVRIIHRDRRLYGAERLWLKFDWDNAWRRGPSPLGPRRGRAATAQTGPETASTTEAESQPTTSSPTSRAATTRASRPARGEPLEVFWTGPLTIRPVDHTPTPTRNRYEVTAVGPQVVLTDPRATAACREFLYMHPQQKGYLRGDDDSPVRLLLAEGADVACRFIRFDTQTGRAELDGSGYMVYRFSEGLAQEKARELIEVEPPVTPTSGDRITWHKNVDVLFAQERVKRPDGRTDLRQWIHQADFYEKVALYQGRTGDFVNCEHLQVHMARGRRVSSYPARAVATGNVFARQEGGEVSAERITVRFRENPQVARPGADAGEAALRGVEPTIVTAEGGVVLIDRSDPAEPLRATADRVTSDRIARTAVLTGSPARIVQGPNEITGPTVRLDEHKQAAVVDGRGILRFLTRRDLSGQRLTVPRPVDIAWASGMEFHGVRDTAVFTGDVTLDSNMDHVACQKMQVMFWREEGPTTATAPATARAIAAAGTRDRPASSPVVAAGAGDGAASAPAPASRPATRRRPERTGSLAVSVERYSRRRISMILADDQVVLASRRHNELGQLIRRLQLTGDKLIYDAQNNRMNVLGHGTFLAEDYRPPEPPKPGASPDDLGALIGRPSQTGFEWQKSMELVQDERSVWLKGGVAMIHHSGDKVVLTERIKVPDWGKLLGGRKTAMTCDGMRARFSPPDEPAKATRPAADLIEGGPTLGPLESFNATGSVNLKDGPRQALAQRLIYNRLDDLAVIWGFLEDQPPANATVLYEDPDTGRSQSWSSPKIIWHRRNNRIVTEQVTGAGGR